MNGVHTYVTGVVQDESGVPLPGATVYIVSGTGSWPDIAALTNDRGEYKLSGMNPGSYVVEVHHDDFVSASASVGVSEEPSRVDITLRRK
jgi:protocatechuate 3,4-dioxygenase beta subunit